MLTSENGPLRRYVAAQRNFWFWGDRVTVLASYQRRSVLGVERECVELSRSSTCDPLPTFCLCATVMWQLRSKLNHRVLAAHNPSIAPPHKARVRFTSETCFVLFGA